MARPMWFVKILKSGFPHIKSIAKLTKLPLLGKIFDKLLFEDDLMFYLPKDQLITVNEFVEKPDDIVLPSQLVEHFINKANYHWIMHFCLCRDSNECKDYPLNLGCLFMGESVKNINPKFGRLVSKEEALEHVKKCREAGLVHVIGKNKLDEAWLGAKPGNKLLTVCNCCPCCCIWRIAPYVNRQILSRVSRMPGVTVRVTDKCIGCGTCTKNICFVEAIKLIGKKANISEICMGCGRCVSACPQKAIEITIQNNQFVKKSIDQITPIIDIS